MISTPVPWARRLLLQVSGKVRRFFATRFRNGHIQAAINRRTGDCARCGACCKLVFKCPFLNFDKDGLALCKIYNSRPKNCRIFPFDNKDLIERDLVPDTTIRCGYSFATTQPIKAETDREVAD